MSANAVPLPAPRRATSSGSVVARQAICLVLALACAGLGLVIAQAYPIWPTVVTLAFGAWFLFAAYRPSWALVALLALIPVVGFAPRTGWILAEEFDLLVLATAGGGYAAWLIRSLSHRASAADTRDAAQVSLVSGLLIALFLASSGIALYRGVSAAGAYRLDWFQNYDDALNPLRVFKSFVWAVLMLPSIVSELRRPQGLDRIALAFTAGLALGALAVVEERYAFTDLLNFSGDYRATGSFWEMHVGGAGLDGFLALTIPFALREVLAEKTRERFAAALVVLGLAGYAVLVTFSRGVYVAVPVALVVAAGLGWLQRPRGQRARLGPSLLRVVALIAAVAVASVVVFRGGGYRAALAVLVLLAATMFFEATSRRSAPRTLIAGALLGLAVAAAAAFVAAFVWKGPYLAFAAATMAFAAATWSCDRDPSDPRRRSLAIASYVWIAVAACHVAGHWGGAGALRDAAIVVAFVVAFALVSRAVARPVWPVDRRRQFATLAVAGAVAATVVVFTAGAYMGDRVSTASHDLDNRFHHWEEGLSRLSRPDDWVLGKGLGRYPATTFYEAPNGEYPGTYRLTYRDGEAFLSLSTPRIKYLDFGEIFRFSQRVAIEPGSLYRVRVEVRSRDDAELHVELCEKHLLYPLACAVKRVKVDKDAGWQSKDIELRTDGFDTRNPLVARPVFFSLADGSAGTLLEIRRVRMIGPGGVDVLANGDFAERTAHWFTSSDRWHEAFHMKSLPLGILFDQGLVGLTLFTLLVGGALIRVAFGRARRHPDAPFLAASLAGFLTVGGFDTLLDMPRVAFLFYVVVMIALAVRSPRLRASPAPAKSAPAPSIDEAAARAERRRMAFGERGAR